MLGSNLKHKNVAGEEVGSQMMREVKEKKTKKRKAAEEEEEGEEGGAEDAGEDE